MLRTLQGGAGTFGWVALTTNHGERGRRISWPHIVADAKRPYDLFEVEEQLQASLSFFGKAERLKRWQLMALDDRELEDRLSRLTSRSRWGR